MSDQNTGLVFLCITCLVPFGAGVLVTLLVQARVKRLGGWGWFPYPAGELIKRWWETRPE